MLSALLSALSLAAATATAQSVQTIQVGSVATASGGVFQFIPPSVTAANGSVITFKFAGLPGNHTVTQSTFASPCEPETGGFDSGWVQIPAGETVIPEWNLTITDDSKPLWFYCKQLIPSPHCIAGMVGAINAPTNGSNTFDAFKAAAEKATSSGQGVGFLVGIGASASADVGPIPSGVSTFGEPTPGADTALASGSAAASGSSASGSSAATASGSSSGSTDSGSASTPSSTTSGASHVAASSIFALFAAALGLVMA